MSFVKTFNLSCIRVKMLRSIAGVRAEGDPLELPLSFGFDSGDVVELPAWYAKRWISAGHCERTDERVHVALADGMDFGRRPENLKQAALERMYRRQEEARR